MAKTIKVTKGWKTQEWLNQEQEAFCQLYVSWDKEFFGNGVQAYIEAYWPDNSVPNWYKTACASASRLLTNDKVIARINELLEEWWLNDQNADKQLLFVMNQHWDLWQKVAAIKEYNKLKQRIIEKTTIDVDLSKASIEELWKIARGGK